MCVGDGIDKPISDILQSYQLYEFAQGVLKGNNRQNSAQKCEY
jgi:hypothetical protein